MDAIEELKEFLRIPSVSTLPERSGDVRRAAEWVRDALRRAGMNQIRLLETPNGKGHPLVYGEWLEAPGKPTLLLYGHYDVQPAEPLEEWRTPPFEPTIVADDIFARGAADDKGQVLILIKAVEQLRHGPGGLPVNVRFLIEGEEEVGGEALEAYLRHHASELHSDAAVICDTEMFAPGLPTICVGLRGIVYGEIHVQGAAQDLHSGTYGGAAPNAIQAACEIVAALKDRDGRIQIPGLLDDVDPLTPAEAASQARLPFDEELYRQTEVGSAALTGEPGFDVLTRTTARPTFEVHGIRGGFIGEGAKTVIPARAIVKVSLRLVPRQEPAKVIQQLEAALANVCPRGVTARFVPLHSAPPSLVDPGNPFVREAATAMSEVMKKETAFIRGGGSIPVVGLLRETLGIPSVLMGFGLPDDNIHAPNEKFHLPNFHLGIQCVVRYLEKLGRL